LNKLRIQQGKHFTGQADFTDIQETDLIGPLEIMGTREAQK
jgi:hypothetical protein